MKRKREKKTEQRARMAVSNTSEPGAPPLSGSPIIIPFSPFLTVQSLSNTQASRALHYYPRTAEEHTEKRSGNAATVQQIGCGDRLTKQS